jgi:hypothetical protein
MFHSGLDLVAVIWGYYMLRGSNGDLMRDTKQSLAMTQMALAELTDLEPAQQKVLAGLTVLHRVNQVHPLAARPVVEFIVSLFQLEYKGPAQRTPLLCACMINSSSTLEYLLLRGANVHAIDYYGRGGLHSALYAQAYMICPESCAQSERETPHQCACPADQVLHESHYMRAWKDCPGNNASHLGDTLRILLRYRCDPNLLDYFGKTPSDYAARRPDLVAVWEEALSETGYMCDPESGNWWPFYQTVEHPLPVSTSYVEDLRGGVVGYESY